MRNVKQILIAGLLVVSATALYSFDVSTHWSAAGSHPRSYEMGVDTIVTMDGKVVSTIKSIDAKIDGFGTYMSVSLPDKYLGKRIRMSGYLRTKDVSDWSSYWLRVDGGDPIGSLEFDNMHDGKADRSVTGTTDWKKCEIVLDVPQAASRIAFGALLVGTGQIWFLDPTFEVVDATVPTTGISPSEQGGDTTMYVVAIAAGLLIGAGILGWVWAIRSRRRRSATS
ncbi:MAG: hypothetical protein IPF59_00935 [Ignavibacteria bacterium]|nr:hypothetical protein [Ignavibacteria bacterium]MBK6418830.1 hypothetical protein [Ignavibacteria bacterium]MBK6760481.1 hypothetical protein [Ignavibacteria bacterium]MBK7411736.1 hypothetical protein [Ignavibacteria bacterium]